MPKIRTVPVGQTPISRYGSWDEHRRAIRRDATRQLHKKLIECSAKVTAETPV
jgi:hypothetical protein